MSINRSILSYNSIISQIKPSVIEHIIKPRKTPFIFISSKIKSLRKINLKSKYNTKVQNTAYNGIQQYSKAKEVISLGKIIIPVTLQVIAEWSILSIALYFAGRLGPIELSSMSLAISCYFITANSIIVSFAMGMESLCGKAYGSKAYKDIGNGLQIGLISAFIFSFIISIIWWNSESIFLRMGQIPIIAYNTTKLLKCLIPYTFSVATFICISKYLIVQGDTKIIPIANTIGIPITIFVGHYILKNTSLALTGVAIAVFLGSIASTGLIWIYAFLKDLKKKNQYNQTWHGWNVSKLKNWKLYLNFVFPSIGIICSEWWAYDLFTVFAGILPRGEVAVGAMGVANAILSLSYSVSMGICAAAGTRVAKAIGSKDIKAVKLSATVSCCISLIIENLELLILILFPRLISKIWTNNIEVIDVCVKVIPYIGLTQLASGVCCMLLGILRSCGQLNQSVICSIVSHWIIGVPLGFILGYFWKLGVTGFYIGLFLASLIQCVWMLREFFKLNYNDIISNFKYSNTS